GIEPEAELGGDHYLVAKRGERLPHQLLVRERAVHLRRVEEGHAALHSPTDQRDPLPAVHRRPEAEAQAHAAEAEGGYFQPTPSQFSMFHRAPRSVSAALTSAAAPHGSIECSGRTLLNVSASSFQPPPCLR